MVILAGGSGTRFWPLSRQHRPKQFLKILGERSLLQETLWRVRSICLSRNIFVVTNAIYRKKILQHLSGFKVPNENILLEPEGKNTAPAIAWVTARVHQLNPDAVTVILPSDHFIGNRDAFLKNINEAVDLANQGYLVTLGIVPDRPETGYGYIKTKAINIKNKKIFKVERFVEKPDPKKAERFLKEKKYLWNSGMFIWRTDTVLNAFHKFLPQICHLFNARSDHAYVKTIWPKLPSISIDYGILEKARNVVTVPASEIKWSDVGSWQALWEVLSKDTQGNVFKGDIQFLDCNGNFVWGSKRLIVTIGLKGFIIIDTPDALLVCPRDQSQKIKEIVEELKKQKRCEWMKYLNNRKSP